MNLDNNFLTWIVSTALFLVTGYVALIRRIDNNKKEQEIKDVEIKGMLQDVQTQLQSMAQLVQMQLDYMKKEIHEIKQWQKEE